MVRRVRGFRWDNDVLLRVNIINRVILMGLVWGMEDGLFCMALLRAGTCMGFE